nr:immunoglobulin light chain junction region [Macaca mulatta]MOX80779.1 immunoglobulin light chain junction region [Macaca mulatta]MOX81573.1 immunoglobulin light chain junction region [Macaca mulatta]MOX81627.1 immunoglobulin light chain junction region [Macaca mulatta]MOX83020.1 immunoglobulin light chain junction region [Macaca mulatta]
DYFCAMWHSSVLGIF